MCYCCSLYSIRWWGSCIVVNYRWSRTDIGPAATTLSLSFCRAGTVGSEASQCQSVTFFHSYVRIITASLWNTVKGIPQNLAFPGIALINQLLFQPTILCTMSIHSLITTLGRYANTFYYETSQSKTFTCLLSGRILYLSERNMNIHLEIDRPQQGGRPSSHRCTRCTAEYAGAIAKSYLSEPSCAEFDSELITET